MALFSSVPADPRERPGRVVMVLGGGGSVGAFQVGALLALTEAGIVPDALYGCSVGALNAAFLAGEPGPRRAAQLAEWWLDTRTHGVIAPSLWRRVRGVAAAAVAGGRALFDERPLRELIARNVDAHDIAELAVPLSVTTTCLDCGEAVHHSRGAVGDLLVASCALPGLFPPVRLADGHRHVDGGVLCGVPVGAAVAAAGPDDEIFVLDCALAPITGQPGGCAGVGLTGLAEQEACGLAVGPAVRHYEPPVESHRGALQVVLSSFTIARGAANRAAIGPHLDDPRVHVLPHVADAWAAGLLSRLPAGPRDCTLSAELVRAGQQATVRWLAGRETRATAAHRQGGHGQRDAT